LLRPVPIVDLAILDSAAWYAVHSK
jgi:hypothetical protein